MRKPVLALVAFSLLLAIPYPAHSAPILDQQFIPTYGFMHAQLRDGDVRAQTFTVGIDGLLTGFEVYLSTVGTEGATWTFGIYPTIGGVPDLASTALAEANITFSGLAETPAFYLGDVSGAGLMVSAGQVYSIVVTSPADTIATWRGALNDDALDTAHYAAGSAFGPTWTSSFGELGLDLGFRTYVEPDFAQPIPEPATLVLLGAGLAGVAGRLRRRRR